MLPAQGRDLSLTWRVAALRPFNRKAALKLKFAKPDRPFGLRSLTLNNMVQDPSMLHETLGYEVMRAAAVAAACRCRG